MTTLQTEFETHELLESHPFAEPLIAGGVKCHGGFADDGTYVSPRTKVRVPAIHAWQEQRAEQFGTPQLDIPLESWPENYPNVDQAKYLLREGVNQPIVSTLTRIGTVEGFGAMIRYSAIPNLQECFDEDVKGTAMTHLERGLYEAHARDEAGFEDEGGHKQMWFASRDIAFDRPVTEDETETMLVRMGIGRPASNGGGAVVDAQSLKGLLMADRILPDDVDMSLEQLIERMARLLLIEISAFHVFAWAETVLSDDDLVAGDGEAARLVSYIRADEAPHVEYLKTVLSEMRDRTFVGSSGKNYAGTDLVSRIWDRAVRDSLGERRDANLKLTIGEVEHALSSNPRGSDILAEFHSLGTVDVSHLTSAAPKIEAGY
ncbi:MAG TPA: hypothetical protein VM030_04445 [Acidimicrobiales bacterium]|nr:hypothetical protein [Acidimicrobiales bacterium]